VEKYGTAGLATQDNIAHALFMLDNQKYRQTDTHTHTEYKIHIVFPR